MQSFYDGMALVGSLIMMVGVIVLTYYATRWYARRMNRTASGKFVKLIDRVTIGPGCSIGIVQAGNEFYLVGFSDKNFQLISKLEDFDADNYAIPTQTINQSFSNIFADLLKQREKSPEDNGMESEK